MTIQQFQNLVNEVGRLLGVEPVFSHDGEVADVGPHDQFELHRSGIVRRRIYIVDHADAKRIAEGMKLEARDRSPFIGFDIS